MLFPFPLAVALVVNDLIGELQLILETFLSPIALIDLHTLKGLREDRQERKWDREGEREEKEQEWEEDSNR